MLKVQRVKAVKTFKKKHFHIENLREIRLDMGVYFGRGQVDGPQRLRRKYALVKKLGLREGLVLVLVAPQL